MSKIFDASDLNTYLSKTLSSGAAQQVVDAVNQYVETQTHRCWGETKQAVERYDWRSVIYLRHMNIVSIDSLKIAYPNQAQQVIAATNYFFNSVTGRLTLFFAQPWNNTSRWNNDLLEITYTYGSPDVPDDLKLAALGIAAGFYDFAASGGKPIVSASIDGYRLQYAGSVRSNGGTGDPANNAADANFAIIRSYAMRRG